MSLCPYLSDDEEKKIAEEMERRGYFVGPFTRASLSTLSIKAFVARFITHNCTEPSSAYFDELAEQLKDLLPVDKHLEFLSFDTRRKIVEHLFNTGAYSVIEQLREITK